jgi:Phage terminase large subunit (GpA)
VISNGGGLVASLERVAIWHAHRFDTCSKCSEAHSGHGSFKADTENAMKPKKKKRDRPGAKRRDPVTPKPKPKPKPKPAKPSPAAQKKTASQSAAYERHKEAAAERQRVQSRAGNDIKPIPAVKDLDRRALCERNFGLFCKEYFPDVFCLPWSDDHQQIIHEMERAVLEGNIIPLCMPRGSGKTALCRRLALWAILYGHREYIFIIAADSELANRSLSAIKKELRFNPRLMADFPEACWPIRRLEGKSVRAGSQHVDGVPTQIVWTHGRLQMPTVKGSPSSGALIDVAGITGQIRGRNELKSDGREIRPDFFILDDPQTRASAFSDTQCDTREQTLTADIIQGAGPGEQVCGIIPCTIIRPNDMAHRLFNKKLHPEFRGRLFKALYSMPKNMGRWEEYNDLLRSSLEEEDETGKVNAFYKLHQAELEEGAHVAWPERVKPQYLTALQELMTLYFLDPEVLAAEYQGDPKEGAEDTLNDLTATAIAAKLTRIDHRIVPADAEVLTAFIDVQKNLFYFVVAAWAEGFTGSVIDYGTWPDVGRAWFRLSQIDKLALAKATNLAGLEEQLYAGMDALTKQLLGREWAREGAGVARIGLCLIDGNWPESQSVVYKFCRQSAFAANLLPSRGHFYGAKSMPISDKTKREGVRRGLEWEIPPAAAGRPKQHLHWDANFWKSFTHARLAAPMGSRGCLALFGDDCRKHRMFSEHQVSEYRVHVEVPGRAVDEWLLKAGEDNHWWDGLVGCNVAASVLGMSLGVHESTKQKKIEPVSYADMYKKARQAS